MNCTGKFLELVTDLSKSGNSEDLYSSHKCVIRLTGSCECFLTLHCDTPGCQGYFLLVYVPKSQHERVGN
ncbi:hypothetical protein BDM02DRAFT_246622 [Thelephora ganbajun]|uniref:Uncharacterized protein n=1 Tax=Thelephora ganbajun TaxID=370292 RepID=A0ACB6ZA19_THEGA|nr:hypothetical protein BDM02DRAFT_246622 [Thelephora ganbajun]